MTINKSHAIFMHIGYRLRILLCAEWHGIFVVYAKAQENEGGIYVQKETIIKITKDLLDFMCFAGIGVTLTLPFSVKWIGEHASQLSILGKIQEHYAECVIIYFVLGILAIAILGELRKIFRTVLADDCFVMGNVVSLQRMGTYSFMIALFSLLRTVLYLTIAMLVVILVFVIAGLFSKVLAMVFDKAIRYKEENDLTI